MTAMKSNPKANTKVNEQFQHLRKGGVGGWRDVFTMRESEAMDELYRSQMKASGLEMDFGKGLQM